MVRQRVAKASAASNTKQVEMKHQAHLRGASNNPQGMIKETNTNVDPDKE